jgi:2-polyprenyl-3-methyl-5-hydroxy-6-metoxy-1,4-benzoquinol methylase
MQHLNDYARIVNNYRNLTRTERFIIWTRFNIIPIKEIISEVSSRGKLLDLGCGFGALSYLFAFMHPRLIVSGVDPSYQRIERAKNVHAIPNNLNFIHGQIDEIDEYDFDTIILIDVLYLMTEEQQISILRKCRERISSDGRLVIKTMNKRHHYRYKLTVFTSLLIKMVKSLFSSDKILGVRENYSGYHNEDEFTRILARSGWKIVGVHDLPLKYFIYPNIIYTCKIQ